MQWLQNSQLPIETLLAGTCLITSLLLAGLFQLISPIYTSTRHLFSFISSSLIICTLFSVQSYFHLISLAMIIYAISFLFRTSPYGPICALLIAMVHLSYIHLQVQFWNASDPLFPDISGPMMILVLKTTTFAWVVHDGTKLNVKFISFVFKCNNRK